MARILTIIGGALLFGGLVLGFIPVSAQATSCGSAFHRSNGAYTADFTRAIQADQSGIPLDDLTAVESACDSRRSGMRIPALVLIIGGLALAVGGLVVEATASRPAVE